MCSRVFKGDERRRSIAPPKKKNASIDESRARARRSNRTDGLRGLMFLVNGEMVVDATKGPPTPDQFAAIEAAVKAAL